MEGWIKIHRKITDNWIWEGESFDKRSAWIDLLLTVNHSERKVHFGKEILVVKAGETVTSVAKLSERWNWSRHKVSNFLNLLEKEEMIIQSRDNKKSTIKVLNFKVYQGQEPEQGHQKDIKRTSNFSPACKINPVAKNSEDIKKLIAKSLKSKLNKIPKPEQGHQKDIKRTSKGHQRDTNKNDKECKEIINKCEQPAIKIADQLLANIKWLNPNFKEPNINRWKDDIEKMLRIDKRQENEVYEVLEYLKKHDFWSGVVLSGNKLRKQYDALVIQMNGSTRNSRDPDTFNNKKVERVW